MIAPSANPLDTPTLEVSESKSNEVVPRTPLYPAPYLNVGFIEQRTVFIHRPSAGLVFRIDDESLLEGGLCHSESWKWTPGFYAGGVTAELEDVNGRTVGTYLLDVSPDLNKLGRDVFREMMRDIHNEDPSLIVGSEPAQTAMGALGSTEAPLVAFSRLRRHGLAFIRALHAISSRPIQSIRQSREWVSMNQARQVDKYTVFAALRNQSVIRLLTAQGDGAVDGAGPIQLDVPKSEFHLDGAANRCINAMLTAVARRIREVQSALEKMSLKPELSETRTALGPRWPARSRFLISLEEQITSVRRRPPFSKATRAEITAAGLNAASAHPLYSRAHSLAWRILRTGISDLITDEELWISPTWEIYERWCFVKLAAMIRAARPEWEWEWEWECLNTHVSRATAAWIGRGNGLALEILLQPAFRSWDHNSADYRSLSGERIPDIVVTQVARSSTRFAVFDAKYRVQRANVLDAMRSAHIYHDALRFRDMKPEISLLLIPASGGAEWLEDKEFHQQYGVGILTLGPEMDAVNSLIQSLWK